MISTGRRSRTLDPGNRHLESVVRLGYSTRIYLVDYRCSQLSHWYLKPDDWLQHDSWNTRYDNSVTHGTLTLVIVRFFPLSIPWADDHSESALEVLHTITTKQYRRNLNILNSSLCSSKWTSAAAGAYSASVSVLYWVNHSNYNFRYSSTMSSEAWPGPLHWAAYLV